jgi:hypothetical protein
VSFKVTGSLEPLERVLGPYADFKKRMASESSDTKLLDIFPFFQGLIKHMASVYDISDEPKNYVFAQIRALHADMVNGNGDRARSGELLQYRPNLGTFVFKSFVGKPHLEEHDDRDLRSSHGIIVDSKFYHQEEGKPVRLLLAVDKTKNKQYAEDLEAGKPFAYSMGATASFCVCDYCGNIATVDSEWCDHMRNSKGKYHKGVLMSESMHGLEYQEESRVAVPADKAALGERLLSPAIKAQDDSNLSQVRAILRENFRTFRPWGW